MRIPAISLAIVCFSSLHLFAQHITGTLQGNVTDEDSRSPLPFVNITVLETDPLVGVSSDSLGNFSLELPTGRYQIQATFIGYNPVIINEVLITSGSNPMLNIRLKELSTNLQEVVVVATIEKERPLNRMATVSAKQLNMEEANRFAGGFDDPARLVTTFAGVASGAGDGNALSVRGNSPKGALWQIEGVPVPNPNHFGDINGFGGGGITALSSKTIGDSDFFTGAFPAEYGNALSSVFDLNIRKGNTEERKSSIQIGFLGLDVASEGPIGAKDNASYLFNYRYSTLGLLDLGITYQDLSFKFNFPTKKAGTFTLWGLGFIDANAKKPDPADTLEADAKWQYYDDISTEDVNISTGILGLSHQLPLGSKGYLKTTATVSASELDYTLSRLDSTFTTNFPLEAIQYTTVDYRLASTLHYKFSARHNNRTGILLTKQHFDFDLGDALTFGDPITTTANDNGNAYLIQTFSQSSFTLPKLSINPGVHFLYMTLNGNYSIEPRLGIDWLLSEKSQLSFGYGLHSQVEKLSYYLADVATSTGGTAQLNKNLGLSRSHHFVLGFDQKLGPYTHMRIEPYYQHHYGVPVIKNDYFSVLNITNEFFINQQLVNDGDGVNKGIDLTLERFMHKGFYYLVTLSLFDSKYTDGSGVVRPTLYNRSALGNVIVGKEWVFKKRNLFNANIRYSYLGGTRTHPIDESASLNQKDIVENYHEAFSIQNPAAHVVSFTVSYRVNHKKTSSLWSLQMLNVSGAKEYLGWQYNFREHRIDPNTNTIVVPNLSWRFEF